MAGRVPYEIERLLAEAGSRWDAPAREALRARLTASLAQGLDSPSGTDRRADGLADDLADDGLLAECRSEIVGCLLHWTRDFTVTHFDRDACAAKGWGRRYFDYVQRSEAICETLCDLDRFARHADLADGFITRLASSDEPVSVGWFLELARGQDDVYHPPTRESFQRHFTDIALLTHKQVIAEEHLRRATASPTYWNDVFTKLGLEAHIANKRA